MNKRVYSLIRLIFLFTLFSMAAQAYSQGADKYEQAVSSGDKYFDAKDYLNAKQSYQVATQLKPGEEYPKTRLQESIRLLRIQMEQMGRYNEKVDFADGLFGERSWENAILAYEEAQREMPSHEYPAEQISLIRKIMAEEAGKMATYGQLLSEGDGLFNAEDFNGAIDKYEEARSIFPDKQEASDKISLANNRLAEVAAQQSGYQRALSEAEMYHGRKDYENELAAYKKAAELKPDEALPQIKIRELNEFLKKYEAYTMFVSQADELYINQSFAEAREKYEKALEVLPDESYPEEIISKINFALAEKTERNKAAYEEAIARADELFNQEDYDAAMMAYTDALRYWAEGEHARTRILRINEIMDLKKAQEEAYANTITLADKLFAEQSYEQAKAAYNNAIAINPFEQYPKVRVEEIDLILEELKNQLELYESIVAGADKLFNVGDYKEARIQYLKAQEILSERSYPVDQVRMIDEILGLEKATREAYLEAIARGDEHFKNREWEDAKVDYVEANDLIPEEVYPDEKINEINDILARLKAEQESYRLALANADQLFIEQDYEAALREYQKAADIFTDEEYPKTKMAEIGNILGEIEKQRLLDEQYATAITKADGLLAEEQLAQAKEAYLTALELKPAEAYPREKITTIDASLSELARLQDIADRYAGAITRADGLFSSGQYEDAKSAYNEALLIKEGATYPAGRISEIDGILEEMALQQATEDAYNAAIARADALLTEENFEEARTTYLEASGIKPGEKYPGNKLKEIDGILAAREEERTRMAKIQADYETAIEDADRFLAEENYDEAREKYGQALALKPAETYPATRISEIDATLEGIARQMQLDQDYAQALSTADKLLNKEEFEEARTAYNEALALKPGEQYPRDQIVLIEQSLAEAARLQGIENAYMEAVAKADNYFENRQYTEARTAYSDALAIKAEEAYPAGQIEEIDGILAKLAQQKATDDAYAAALAQADGLFAEENYSEARTAYLEAAAIKPKEDYPGQRVKEIDGILKAAEAEAARLAKLEADYIQTLEEADAQFAGENFSGAREKYDEALALKPAETYPAEKITEIDRILAGIEEQRILDQNYANAIARADELFESKDFIEAKSLYREAAGLKPSEQYPADRMAQIDAALAEIAQQQELDQAYSEAIDRADKFFSDSLYDEARASYLAALELKAGEAYPTDKVREIDAIYAEIARQEALLAEQNKQYEIALNTANNYFESRQYEEAREAYTRAQAIKPGETYPAGRIDEIDRLLEEREQQRVLEENYANALARGDNFLMNQEYAQAREEYEKALQLKEDEEYPATKISEIDAVVAENARIAEMEANYAASIAEADNYFAGEQYEQAREAYGKALTAKPADQYALAKSEEVSAILAEQARQQELEESYAETIQRADLLLDDERYEEAKTAYREALLIKQNESYPAEKIAGIDAVLEEQAARRAVEMAYGKAISRADSLFGLKQYAEAREDYSDALRIKDDSDNYPVDQIAEIDRIVAEIERLRILEENYAKTVNDADARLETNNYLEALQLYEEALSLKPGESYPSGKIAEINSRLSEMEEERQKAYDEAIVQADNYYSLGNYRSAKSAYQTAVNIKSDEQYARDRLEEVSRLYAAELEALRVDYQKYIADADNYFNEKIYDGAIENYRLAAAILPDEAYPGKMISRITQIINDNAITDVNRLAQVIPNNTDRRFEFPELPVNVRKQNYILIKARNMGDQEFKMLVNFGRDGSKTGGVVLKVPAGGEAKDYIIRIGALYRWFSEDNNWISIYPEGGDIEVALIRISKSD